MNGHDKFLIVLDGKLEPGTALNAAGHMAACLAASADEHQRQRMSFVDYHDRDQHAHPVSALSLVVLRAKNSNQLRKAREEAQAKGLLQVDFLATMTGGTAEEQMERTRVKSESELEYWGLAMFGLADEIDPISRRFSLWR